MWYNRDATIIFNNLDEYTALLPNRYNASLLLQGSIRFCSIPSLFVYLINPTCERGKLHGKEKGRQCGEGFARKKGQK